MQVARRSWLEQPAAVGRAVTIPLTAIAFYGLHRWGAIAHIPLWALYLILAGAGLASFLAERRWPAHCTGLLALRPTAGRVPGTGQLPTPSLDEPLIPNEVTLQGRIQVMGPLARTVEDLEVAVRAMAGPDGFDPFTVPVNVSVQLGSGA